MEFLLFQLQGFMASWGEAAVGEYRGSRNEPGASALVGLIGAALGIERDDEPNHAALRDGYGFAVGTVATGQLLRDYHTVQVPSQSDLKGRPHRTRRDELAVPKQLLNTILSKRDYRQGGAWIVAVQALSSAPHTLPALDRALREPHFVLYLGRKSCPPGAPLAPVLKRADSVLTAMRDYAAESDPPVTLQRLVWTDGVDCGRSADLSMPRKDRLIRRRGWQFGDRTEYVAILEGGD